MPLPVFLVNVSRAGNQVQFPIGLGVLANALKLEGLEVRPIDLVPVPEADQQEHFDRLLPNEPAIFGFSMFAGNHQLDEAEKYARRIREQNPDHVIVYGGSLPSSIPEMLMERAQCDYVISSEGEESFPAFVKALQRGERRPGDVPGLYFRADGKVVNPTPSKKLVKLHEHSNVDLDFFDTDWYVDYLRETGQSWELMATRGCVQNCSFCYKMVGTGFSIRTPEAVLDEVQAIMERYGLNRFYFVDDDMMTFKKWLGEFIEIKKARGLDFTFRVQARINALEEDLLRMLIDHGLRNVSTGVESASQATLDLVEKRTKVETVEAKLQLARDLGLGITANLIIGFPWEREKHWTQLIDFVQRNQLHHRAKLSYLTPLPHTRQFDDAVRQGYIPDQYEYIRNLGDLFWERMINLTSEPDEVLTHYYQAITDIVQRHQVFPQSEKYRSKLSTQFHERVPEHRRAMWVEA